MTQLQTLAYVHREAVSLTRDSAGVCRESQRERERERDRFRLGQSHSLYEYA